MPLDAPRGAMPWHLRVSTPRAEPGMHVVQSVAEQFDFGLPRACSPSPVTQCAQDPMLCEAALYMPSKGVSRSDAHATCNVRAHSIDLWPCGGQAPLVARGES